MKIIYDMKGV